MRALFPVYPLLQAAFESGVPFSLHDGRRVTETALESTGIHPNWAKVIRGRKVSGSENPYSRPAIEALRDVYRRAAPLLSFTTLQVIVSPLEAEKTRVRAFIDSSNLPLEIKMKALSSIQKATTIGEVLETKNEFRIKSEAFSRVEKRAKKRTKVVDELELENDLNHGWKFASVLPSGKILIERA